MNTKAIVLLGISLVASAIGTASYAQDNGTINAAKVAPAPPKALSPEEEKLRRHEGKQSQGIRFEHGSFDELKRMAAAESKIIFIDAFTTWCGPCKQMAKNVFPDPIVGKYFNDKFINAKIDMEAGEGIEIAKMYEVRAYPSYLFVAADGELVHRAVGSMPPADFIMVGHAATTPEERISTWQKRFDAGDRDPKFIGEYFRRANDAGLNVSNSFMKYLSDQPVEILLDSNTWSMYAQFGSYAMTRELAFVKENKAKIKKAIPQADVDGKLNALYRRPLNKAYAIDGPTSEQYKKLDAEFRAIKTLDGEKLADFVLVEALDPAKDPDKYGEAMVAYYRKHPDQTANWLNSVAWSFYENVSNDKHLAVAEKMIKTALKLEPTSYAAADTYAYVLFKRGRLEAATKAATEAIGLGLNQKEDVSSTQDLILQIKEAGKANKVAKAKKS